MTKTQASALANQSTANAEYSKGLEGVIAAETALSLVDGVESKLFYRGIPIKELAENSTFEETIYLLWYGQLPTSQALKEFSQGLASYREASPFLFELIQKFPKKAHPMAVLRTAVSALGMEDPDAENINPQALLKKSFRVTSVIPSLLAAFYRYREGKKLIPPDRSISHAANFLHMLHGEMPNKEMERALDTYLILLADHGLNASTFSARVTAATQSDLYSCVTSAIGTLKGDLHGSANQRAMEMILEIGSPEKAEPYINNLLEHKKKIMGFGHRIYKNQDPRAEAFREIARVLTERAGEKRWLDISNKVEKVVWEKKHIPCNVDFFSASVLYILGFPIDFFTTVFAASRVGGWTAHVVEQHKDNRLIRPSAKYTGPINQHYLPVTKRK